MSVDPGPSLSTDDGAVTAAAPVAGAAGGSADGAAAGADLYQPARDIRWARDRVARIAADSPTGIAIARLARAAGTRFDPGRTLEAAGVARAGVRSLVMGRMIQALTLAATLLVGLPLLILAVGAVSGAVSLSGVWGGLAAVYAMAMAVAALALAQRFQGEVAALLRWAPNRALQLALDRESLAVAAGEKIIIKAPWREIALAGAETRRVDGAPALTAISVTTGPKTVVPIHRDLWDDGDDLLAQILLLLIANQRIELV